MTPPSLNRHYRAPAVAVRCVRGFLTFGVLIGVLSLLDNHSGIPGWAFALVYYGCLAGIAAWTEWLMPLTGVYESAEGLRFVHSLGSETFRWDSIARFEHSPTRPRSQVLVVGHDGRRRRPIGTAQGSRIRWDDGETDDIVGVLNECLRLWRSAVR